MISPFHICSRCAAILIVISSIAGCATQKVAVTSSESPSWQWRQQQLNALNHWSFDGRVAVRDAAADGWNASMSWQQNDDQYDIRLFGLLGQGGARIHGDYDQAVIEAGDQAPQSAASPEALMMAQLGWYVPVQGLKYWLMGQPTPNAVLPESDYELDHVGRLARIDQDGWEITYKRYMRVNGVELPSKLELKNQRLRVRLVIDQWRLHTSGDA